MANTYQEKPQKVEAMKLVEDSIDACIAWLAEEDYEAVWYPDLAGQPALLIQVPTGTVSVVFGQWILRNSFQEIWPISSGRFARMYELLPE